MKFFNTIATRLPQWVLALIAILLIVYIGVLGGVAISTERDVKIWPPEIGPGPKSKLVEEFKLFRSDMGTLNRELLEQRKVLNERLHQIRVSAAAATAKSNYYETRSWEINAGKLEDEIKAIDNKLISKIDEAKKEAQEMENKFNGL